MNETAGEVLSDKNTILKTDSYITVDKQCPALKGTDYEDKTCDIPFLQQFIPKGYSCGTPRLPCLRDIEGVGALYAAYIACKDRGIVNIYQRQRCTDRKVIDARLKELEEQLRVTIEQYFQ